MKNFTVKNIETLKPQNVRYEIREKDGFTLRITPTGIKTWGFTYDFLGQRRRMTLGQYPQITLKEARTLHRNALTNLEKGIDPGAEKIQKRLKRISDPTVKNVVDEYLKHRWFTNLAASSKISYRVTLEKELVPDLGTQKILDIKPRDIRRILDKIIKRGALVQAKRTKAHLQRFFHFAIVEELIQINPVSSIDLDLKTSAKTRYLKEEEIKQFWSGLVETNLSEMFIQALRLQLVTGQRKGEICKARWDSVDWEACTWTIPKEVAKNRTKHVVRLSSLALEVLAVLQSLTGKTEFFLPSPLDFNKHVLPNSLDRAFRDEFDKLGIAESFSPHDLRRTTASHMEELHIPIDYIKRILNHTLNRGVTAVYTHYDAHKEVQEAMETWSTKLREILDIPLAPITHSDPKIIQLHQPENEDDTRDLSSQSN